GRRDRSVAEREHLAHRFAAELVAMRVTAAADSPGPDLVDQRSFAQRQLDWLAAGTERFWWFRTAGPIPQQVVTAMRKHPRALRVGNINGAVIPMHQVARHTTRPPARHRCDRLQRR